MIDSIVVAAGHAGVQPIKIVVVNEEIVVAGTQIGIEIVELAGDHIGRYRAQSRRVRICLNDEVVLYVDFSNRDVILIESGVDT